MASSSQPVRHPALFIAHCGISTYILIPQLTLFAGCVGVLAVFSIGDMVVYNRRKRAIYFEDQELEQAKILALARNSVLEGTASPAQTALVEGIAEEERLMEQKKAERKIPSKLLWWMHGDWNEEKALKEQRALAVNDFKMKEAEAAKATPSVTQAVQEARTNASQSTVGGPLDQEAAKATKAVENTGSGSFWGSIMGKK
jgi:hypothetical protein